MLFLLRGIKVIYLNNSSAMGCQKNRGREYDKNRDNKMKGHEKCNLEVLND